MRKIYFVLFSLVAMLLSFNSTAQEVVTLKFEAEHQDHSYQQLDSILVTNLTKGWTEVLYYPDTILTMNTVGIHGWENEKGSVKLYQNVPNPFNGITDFKLMLLNKEKVDLMVFDINGKKVAEYHNTLPSGEHQFRATMNTPQTYLLSAVTKNGNTSIKMINLSNTGEQARIEYVGSMPLTVESTKKHTNNLFSQGDNMQYVGYATQIDGSKETTVTQKQQGSGTVTFVFPNEDLPASLTVRTDSAYNLTSSTAILSGSWKAHKMTVTEEGFTWKLASESEWDTLTCDHTDPEFTFGLRNLKKETAYVFKAYAIADDEYYWGEEVTFSTTKIVPPTVTTDSVTEIDYNRARVHGSYAKGEESVKKIGFELLVDGEWNNIRSFIGTQMTSPFTTDIFDLKKKTEYSVRAYAITESDTTYAEPVVFATPDIAPPIVKTLEATEVASVKAMLHGTFTKTSEDVTACGFEYKIDGSDIWTTLAATLTPEFSAMAMSLTPSTKYVFKAFAQTATDKAYGEELTFSTGEYVMPSVEAGEVTEITRTSAKVSAKQSNGAEVIERGFLYSLYPGTELTSDANYRLIKIVKDASTEDGEFSATLSLTQGAIYYVRGYAKTSDFVLYTEDMKVVMQDPEGLKDCGTATDADGNEYRTVVLGANCWTRENLRTTKLSDGTPIKAFAVNTTDHTKLPMTECYYVPVVRGNDTLPKDVVGCYYNYGTALSKVSACPVGWRVATFDDYMELFAYVKETYNVSGTLNTNKTTGYIGTYVAPYMVLPHYWNGKPLQNGTNETGFNYFYGGDINWSTGNGGYSYYRFEGRYDALLTSTPASEGSDAPWFMQTTGSTNNTWQKYFNKNASYGQFIRCVKEPEPVLGTVETKSVEQVTYHSAALAGEITSTGYSLVSERGFCWNTEENPTVENHKQVVEGSSLDFSTVIDELTPATTYYVKAYMTNTVGTSYGEQLTFTTQAAPTVPVVVTGEVHDKMLDQVSVDGSVTDDCREAVTARGICYATTAGPTTESMVVECGEGLGNFTAVLKNLEKGQTYYARAYATNKVGTSYGEEIVFTPLIEAEKPTVHTLSVMGISDRQATVNGEVTSSGGADVTERGICYSKTNETPDMGDLVIRAEEAGLGSYQIILDSLDFETTYYVRAYAVNEVGTAYGEALTFTTLEEVKEMVVMADGVTDVTRTSATVSAKLLHGVDVTERGFIYSLYENATHKSHPTVVLIGSKTVEGTDNGEFSTTFDNFVQGAIYYVRGYVKTEIKGEDNTSVINYYYSNDMKVVMQDPEGLVSCGTVTDADGNEYRTVQLGTQCWMRENLKTTKYNDGAVMNEFIPVGSTIKVSRSVTEYTPDIVTYNGYSDTLSGDMAGFYYGYGFRHDPNGNKLCPTGWHVPTVEEFGLLFDYVNNTYCGGSLTVNKYTTSKTTQICNDQNLYYPLVLPHYFGNNGFKNANENSNATGFGWFYFGELNGNSNASYYRTTQTYWEGMWTSTEQGSNMNCFVQHANGVRLEYINESSNPGYGRVIRCVKDAE